MGEWYKNLPLPRVFNDHDHHHCCRLAQTAATAAAAVSPIPLAPNLVSLGIDLPGTTGNTTSNYQHHRHQHQPHNHQQYVCVFVPPLIVCVSTAKIGSSSSHHRGLLHFPLMCFWCCSPAALPYSHHCTAVVTLLSLLSGRQWSGCVEFALPVPVPVCRQCVCRSPLVSFSLLPKHSVATVPKWCQVPSECE